MSKSFGKFTREQVQEFTTMSAGEHLKFIRKVDPLFGTEIDVEAKKYRIQLYRKCEVTEIAEMEVWAISENDAETKADDALSKPGVENGLRWTEEDCVETETPTITDVVEV